MLLKRRLWFRCFFKDHTKGSAPTNPDSGPPPYPEPENTKSSDPPHLIHVCPAVAPRAIVVPAAAACIASSQAITARAIAEHPNAASAMASALEQIKTTTKTTLILQARDMPPHSLSAASIWVAVLDASAREARKIANHADEPDFATERAAYLEKDIATGGVEDMVIKSYKRRLVKITR